MDITSPRAVLLSDIHLSPDRPDITERLVSFLHNKLDNVEQLFFLGDIFDYWIGDDLALTGKDPLARQLAAQLKNLSEKGMQIFFMHGNRDFLLGQPFADCCGAQLLDDPCTVTLYNHKILLSHGDAWCTDDLDYQQFRQMVRAPKWQKNFLAQSLEDRLQQAVQARNASKDHTSQAEAHIMDVNAVQIDQAFTKHDIRLIIHGHTHRPADHSYHNGNQRLVLGDWYHQSSWLSIDSNNITRTGETVC